MSESRRVGVRQQRLGGDRDVQEAWEAPPDVLQSTQNRIMKHHFSIFRQLFFQLFSEISDFFGRRQAAPRVG